MFQTYSSLPPLWSSGPVSPKESGSVIIASTVIPFFAHCFRDRKGSEWLSKLAVQWDHGLSPSGNIPHSSRPAEQKVWGMGS